MNDHASETFISEVNSELMRDFEGKVHMLVTLSDVFRTTYWSKGLTRDNVEKMAELIEVIDRTASACRAYVIGHLAVMDGENDANT